MTTLAFTLNGAPASLDVEPRETLLEVLRERLRLTGAKRSCEVQVCGACTVLVDGDPVSACCLLAFDVDGRDVTTIEGIARREGFDRLVQPFLDHFAVQCGFCTPAFVLSTAALLAAHEAPSDEDIAHYLHGNVCRCTGYRAILHAVASARDELDRETAERLVRGDGS